MRAQGLSMCDALVMARELMRPQPYQAGNASVSGEHFSGGRVMKHDNRPSQDLISPFLAETLHLDGICIRCPHKQVDQRRRLSRAGEQAHTINDLYGPPPSAKNEFSQAHAIALPLAIPARL